MTVWKAETAQGKGCSQGYSWYEVIALERVHNLSKCNI